MKAPVPVLPWVLLLCLVAAPASAEERFALLLGANVGWANDRPLRYAESDAERMRQVLVELGGFPSDRVYLLRDPSTEEVRARLSSLGDTLRSLGRDSLVVFYYSGHADERHLHLRGSPLSLSELQEALKTLPATARVLMLDVCRSGSLSAARQEGAAPTLDATVEEEWSARGFARVTVRGADELSRKARGAAGSVFTHHLVSALRGAGDSNEDGGVTLTEAWRHALRWTWEEVAPRRTPPSLPGLAERAEPVLTQRGAGAARLVLPAGQGERYVVVDEPELRLVAEGHTRPEGPLVLALAPGRYRVKRVRAAQLEAAEVTLEPELEVVAASLTYVSQPESRLLRKGAEGLPEQARHEWKRGEALRLLAAGEAKAALDLFDALLEQEPRDSAALRGKARALVRLAELHGRQENREQEAHALRMALEADPSLAEAPDFADTYRHLQEFEASQARTAMLRETAEKEVTDNPRRGYRWGIGGDFLGRGLFAVSGTRLIGEHWFPYLAFDLLSGPAVDAGVRFVPGHHPFSPYFGVGGRLLLTDAPLLIDQENELQLFGSSVHAGAGFQLFTQEGLAVDMGLEGLFVIEHGKGFVAFWPMLNLSVHYFRR
jgi:tetratricopeptide (TPR) repeat protein